MEVLRAMPVCPLGRSLAVVDFLSSARAECKGVSCTSMPPVISCRPTQSCERGSPLQAWQSASLCWTQNRRNLALNARRKTSTVAAETAEEVDPDVAAGLNEVSTEALKVMLGEDIQQLKQFKDKVDFLGEYLVGENQLDAARFMLVIKGMLDHQILPETHDLQGPYKKAFDKIWGVVEDSGWLLTQPGAEGGEVQMVDDELIPPVIQTRY